MNEIGLSRVPSTASVATGSPWPFTSSTPGNLHLHPDATSAASSNVSANDSELVVGSPGVSMSPHHGPGLPVNYQAGLIALYSVTTLLAVAGNLVVILVLIRRPSLEDRPALLPVEPGRGRPDDGRLLYALHLHDDHAARLGLRRIHVHHRSLLSGTI